MNQLLDILYRIIKVVYVGVIVFAVGVAVSIAWVEKPHEGTVQESLYCDAPLYKPIYNTKTFRTEYKNDLGQVFLEQSWKTILKKRDTYIGSYTGQSICESFGYRLNSIVPTNGIVGSWREVVKNLALSLLGIYIVAELARRIFRYIFFKESPFYFPNYMLK